MSLIRAHPFIAVALLGVLAFVLLSRAKASGPPLASPITPGYAPAGNPLAVQLQGIQQQLGNLFEQANVQVISKMQRTDLPFQLSRFNPTTDSMQWQFPSKGITPMGGAVPPTVNLAGG